MEYQTVRTETRNGALWIRLSRPDRLNAFNGQMAADLLGALKEGESTPEIGCIVVTGEGRAFSAGEDIDSEGTSEGGEQVRLGEAFSGGYNPIVQKIRKMDKPVLAAVNGVAAGMGLGLVLACDVRAASAAAEFCESLVGEESVRRSGTLFWLTRILGVAKAMEVVALGEPIDARVALNEGLVDWVFPQETFGEEVARIAERLASGQRRALAQMKRTLNRAVVVDPGSALEYEAYLRGLAGRTGNRQGTGPRNSERDSGFTRR